ncbi:tape measure protein [Ideonella sp.]|uniref:tape measure protein n=1 Tax=Ideonella sp. TaxID=1929293 RepID=UPI003BB806E9
MAAESVVSLRLRILEEGLSNLTGLIGEIDRAGGATDALKQQAGALGTELERLKGTQADTGSAATELGGALDRADASLGTAQANARRLADELGAIGQAGRDAAGATNVGTAALDRANTALAQAERAATSARAAKNALIPADVGAAEAALSAAQAQRAQAAALATLETAAAQAGTELLKAGGSSDVFAKGLDADPVRALVAELNKLGTAVDPAVAARAKTLADELQRLGAQNAAATTLRTLVTESERARAALQGAEQALEGYSKSSFTASESSLLQARRQRELTAEVDKARSAYLLASGALAMGAQAARTAGVDVEAVARAQREVVASSKALATAANAAGAAQVRASAEAVTATQAVRASLQGVHTSLKSIETLASTAIGGTMLAVFAKDLADTADQAANLQAKIKLVTGEGAAFSEAWQGVAEVALRTHSSLTGTVELFTRIVEIGKSMNLSQQQALALTESINQSVQIGGASAQASEAAVAQLVQGLQSGVLRGDEFNSVMEQAPRLAKALADSLGVTTGELRKLAEAGELSSQTVVEALQRQGETLQREFDKLPLTVGRALADLSTRWTEYIGNSESANGATRSAAEAIEFLSKHIDDLAQALYLAGKAAIAFKVLELARTFSAISVESRAAAAGITLMSGAQAAATRTAAAATTATAASAAGIGVFGRAMASTGLAIAGPWGAALTVVLAFGQEIGTFIGEGIAKFMGWGKVLRDNEAIMAANAQKQKELEEASKRVSVGVGELAVKYGKLNEQNDKAVELAQKKKAAQDAESKQISALAGLYGNAQRGLELLNEAAQKSAQVGEAVAQAREKAAETLAREVAEMRAAAGDQDRWSKGTRDQITALEQRRDASIADSQASRAEAEQLNIEAQSRALAIAKTADHSKSLTTLKTAYVEAQANVARLTDLESKGWVTHNEVARAARLAAAAHELYADALNDAVDGFERQRAAMQRGVAISQSALELDKERSRTEEKLAASMGNTTRVTEEQIRQKEIDLKISQAKITALRQEAAGLVELAQKERAALDANDPLVEQKQAEIQARIDNAKVMGNEANQLEEQQRQIQNEIDLLRRRGNAAQESSRAVVAGLEAEIEAQERANALREREIELKNKARNTDANGFSKDMTGNQVINAEGATALSVINILKSYGLTDEQAKTIAAEFSDNSGGVRFSGQYGASSLSEALRRAAEKRLTETPMAKPSAATDASTDAAPAAGSVDATLQSLQAQIMAAEQAAIAARDPRVVAAQAALAAAQAKASASPTGTTSAAAATSTSHTVTINLNGKATEIGTASDSDSQALVALLTQLGQAATTAG